MSKLGIHVASAKRMGFGEILDAGPACVVSIDQNVMGEVKRRAPKCVTAFRTQKSALGEDNPPGLIDSASEAAAGQIADSWMTSLFPIWGQNPGADYYLVNNELDVSMLASAVVLNAFYLRCMALAEAKGLHAGICSFSAGCPSDDGGLTLEERWKPLLPAVEHAEENGHVIVLHVHAMEGNLADRAADIALRHERTLKYFAVNRLHPKVLIGELSNGTGGVQPNTAEYLKQVTWWDQQVMASRWRDQVIGGALYGFNAGETLTPAALSITDWIKGHPTPTDPIDPPAESRQYDRVYHLLAQSATYDQRLMVDFDADPRGETVGKSLDDAFITHPSLRSRTVYVWNMKDFAEFHEQKAELEAWVMEHYAPLPTIIYRETA